MHYITFNFRRQEVKDELKKSSDALSQLLDSCLSNATDNQLHIQV